MFQVNYLSQNFCKEKLNLTGPKYCLRYIQEVIPEVFYIVHLHLTSGSRLNDYSGNGPFCALHHGWAAWLLQRAVPHMLTLSSVFIKTDGSTWIDFSVFKGDRLVPCWFSAIQLKKKVTGKHCSLSNWHSATNILTLHRSDQPLNDLQDNKSYFLYFEILLLSAQDRTRHHKTREKVEYRH